MMRARVLLAAVVGLLLVTVARAETPVTEPQRYQTLIHELRCLVCQNQSIAESNAPLAQDLREQVASQMAAGRSDDEIRDYLTARYGDFVLYRPPLRWRTARTTARASIGTLEGANKTHKQTTIDNVTHSNTTMAEPAVRSPPCN